MVRTSRKTVKDDDFFDEPEIMEEVMKIAEPLLDLERRPCNWHVVKGDKGVSAVSIISGRPFEGTAKEFSAFLRS